MYRHLWILPDGTEVFSGAEQENVLRSVKVTQSVNSGTELTLGSACSAMMEAELITPGGGLSTPAVFKAWNAGGYPMTPVETDALADALLAGDLSRAQALAHNDLEAPAISLMPEIGELIERFRRLGARFVRMTGSGSTVFAAFDSDEAAQAAAAAVPGAIFTRTSRRT